MARRLVRASSSHLTMGLSVDAITGGPCTMVGLIHKNTDAQGQAVLTGVHVGDGNFEFYVNSSNELAVWNNDSATGTSAAAATCTIALGWCLVAMTKATGTTTPRFHRKAWAGGGAWVHADAAGTLANTSSTWLDWRVGAFASADDSSDHDFAAVMFLPRVMSDGEIEGLARGRWVEHNPLFLAEFPSDRDLPAGVYRSIGRRRELESSKAGNQRSARPDPPGFRYSVLTRRG